MKEHKVIDKKFAIRYPEAPTFSNLNWRRYQQFRTNWDFSHSKLTQINIRLNHHFKGDNNFSVLVAGSYGRMDAHEKSDLDFLIVHN